MLILNRQRFFNTMLWITAVAVGVGVAIAKRKR
jgi:hypothetical protein